MKYFSRFKGLIFIALTCIYTAPGSAFASSALDNLLQNNGQPETYSLSVSAGQEQNHDASANLTISGENSRVSVEKEGTVKLVAGKSIILRPGTKISSGSFLYAAIEPSVKAGKQGKKIVKIVTIEEKKKIDEQVSLSVAYTLFKPFPSSRKGMLRKGNGEHGNLDPSGIELSAVTPEQQRKVVADTYRVNATTRLQTPVQFNTPAVPSGYRPETMRVLRL